MDTVTMGRLVFWFSCALSGYAYFGYPLFLYLFVRSRPVLKQGIRPTVSILIAARNEESSLRAKLKNLCRGLDYPRQLTQIIVVSDGSTDETAAILGDFVPAVLPVLLSEPGGKAAALNQGVRRATGEILIFLDARQTLDADAVSELVCCFADPRVGAVSGELVLESAEAGDALGLYWKIEKAVRRLESESGSVVGVTGAIYAIRRELYVDLPPGAILDDVLIPMQVARAGRRVIFQPTAIARDRIFNEPGKEFGRKVRTLTGNYQLVRLAPWLLSFGNPLLFRFVSHKLARLVVPLFLVLMLLSSARAGGLFYLTVFWGQVLFYTAAFVGMVLPFTKRLRLVAVASTFVMLNAAAVLAFYNFVRSRDHVWR